MPRKDRKTTGARIADRAVPRRPQTYCPCGEPKRDRAKYCVECAAEMIVRHSRNRVTKRIEAIRLKGRTP